MKHVDSVDHVEINANLYSSVNMQIQLNLPMAYKKRISQDLHHLGVNGNTFSNVTKNTFQTLSVNLQYSRLTSQRKQHQREADILPSTTQVRQLLCMYIFCLFILYIFYPPHFSHSKKVKKCYA